MNKEDVYTLQAEFEQLSAQEVIMRALAVLGKNIALASSLSLEDQVVTHMLADIDPHPRIFTLDTGRLHQETYDVIDRTMEKYGITFEICFPESEDIVTLESSKGPNSFYKSFANRKECCFVRKVKPLKKKLGTLQAWMTGLRREQSITRTELKKIERDDTFDLIKVNPIADWSRDDVWGYIQANDIPYNTLHDKGYPSIGCAPCTRAVKPGEDSRAGRWWWEAPEKKECGLHIKNGKIMKREG